MKTIHKFPINIGATSITLPAGSQVLTAREQGDNVCIWVLLDPSLPSYTLHTFHVFGTGFDVPDDPTLTYRGSAMLHGGRIVFHVFEETGGARVAA